MTKKFNVKTWVKEYFGLSVNDKSLDNTNNSLEFIWVWSIFEHKYLKDSRLVLKLSLDLVVKEKLSEIVNRMSA